VSSRDGGSGDGGSRDGGRGAAGGKWAGRGAEREKASRAVLLLRRIAFAEGISFLVLLCIAMPLKYWAGVPLAVKIVGWAHGVLFVSLLLALAQAKYRARWSIAYAAWVVIAALLPFGPFVIDRRLQRDAAAGV
jgi:integral membrane protein